MCLCEELGRGCKELYDEAQAERDLLVVLVDDFGIAEVVAYRYAILTLQPFPMGKSLKIFT